MSARGFRRLFTIACVTALVLTAVGSPYSVQAADEGGKSLQGSWIVTTTIAGDPNSPFKSLASITGDGTFVESLQPGLNPFVSDCHGVWARTGHHEFATTCVYLRSDTVGNPIGSTKVRAIAELDRTLNQGSASFQADLFDLAGNHVSSFTGTSQFDRILLERLH